MSKTSKYKKRMIAVELKKTDDQIESDKIAYLKHMQEDAVLEEKFVNRLRELKQDRSLYE